MKMILGALSIVLLCSCAGAPVMQSSFNGSPYSPGPSSADDPRLRAPQYYMDDDKSPAQSLNRQQTNQFHAVDNFCNSSCQSRGGTAQYCNQACGY